MSQGVALQEMPLLEWLLVKPLRTIDDERDAALELCTAAGRLAVMPLTCGMVE